MSCLPRPRFARALVLSLLAAGLGACGSSSGPTAPAPTRALVYAALGASDAVGVGAVPLRNGYVFDLRDRMTAAGFVVTFHNFGISGAKADEIAAEALPQALAASPDVVSLWTGANDLVAGRAPDLFASQLDGILAELSTRTRALVLVGDLPDLTRAPLFLVAPDPDVSSARIDAFNARIRAAAGRHGGVPVALSALSTEPSMFFIDGFHPSNLGHRRIADLFWVEMAPRL